MTIAAESKQELVTKQEVVKPIKPALGLPLSALLNRVILFGAGVGLLTWGITLTVNRVTSVTAAKAFVNGKIITINSPLNGQIQANANLDSGMTVNPKQLLLKVNESLSNAQWLQSLKLDLITEQAKLESIDSKIRDFGRSGQGSPVKQNQQQRQKSLEVETPNKQTMALARLEEQKIKTEGKISVSLAEQNLKEAEIELKVAQRHAQVAQSKYNKYQALGKAGAMSKFSVEEVLNNWRVSQAQVEGAQVKLDTAKLHLTEQQRLNGQKVQQQRLQNAVRQSTDNKLSFSTKTEDLNPELAELIRQKTEIQISIQAKTRAIAEAEKSSLAQNKYAVLASDQGVLWEVMVHNGEQVKSGQPLLKQLNCEQLWVDAFVNIDSLKRIKIGSPAQVELYGENIKLNGWVKTIRSPLSREQKLGQDAAISPPDVENQQLAQVRIELENPKELSKSAQSSAQFCQVGQVAKVNIDPKDSLLANLPSW